MKNLQLDIDGFIGEWGYSKSLIKNFLKDAGKDPVTVRISSLGGDIDHAISIYDQFAEHGSVTVLLSGFNASAATLITLSARKVIINSNSFYLIHKALNFVDTWGNMNEDDIDSLIISLEAEKKTLEKVTLVLAKMYSKKSGKTTAEILALMKQESWLNAEEALLWGFVDEIAEPVVNENLLTNRKLVSMLNYSDLPIPQNKSLVQAPVAQLEQTDPGIIETLKKFINSKFIMKQFELLNNLLTVPSLESSEEGIYLNEAQAELINNALALNSTLAKEHAIAVATLTDATLAMTAQRDEAIVARDLSITNASAAADTVTAINASLDAIDPSIATGKTTDEKILAIRNFMAAKPGVAPVGVITDGDPLTQSESDNIKLLNSLPHMQED